MSTQQLSAQRRNSSIKQLIGGLMMAFMTICLTFLGLEVGTRLLLSPPYNPATGEFYACNNRLGWTGELNFRGVIEDPNFRQELSFNSLGMHDSEHPLEKSAEGIRILLLGDSFVQAVQVNEAETAHQILEDYLNEQNITEKSNIEVLSSGVVNWGTNQQLVYYREQGQLFGPDLVLLAFYIGNDLADNLPGNVVTSGGFNCYAPYFAICDGKLNPEPLTYAPGISDMDNNCSALRRGWINSGGWLFQHSRLYQQLEPLLVANYPRQQFGQGFPSAFSALYFPSNEAELKQAWQITEATMAQLKQEVEANGSQFAVALISPDIVVRLGVLSPAEQAAVLKDDPILADAQADRPNQRLSAFLHKQNIPFIDLTPAMIEHLATNPTPLYILGEGHWTVEGNRIAGEVVAQWLMTNNLLSEKTAP